MAWNKAEHSKAKIGIALKRIVVSIMPSAAQANKFGMLHLRLIGDSYITVHLRETFDPALGKAIYEALMACPDEPSYSQSGNHWKQLVVEPSESGQLARILAGQQVITVCQIDSNSPLISSDEPIEQEPGDLPGSGPAGPAVN